jgi:hypothetical protein
MPIDYNDPTLDYSAAEAELLRQMEGVKALRNWKQDPIQQPGSFQSAVTGTTVAAPLVKRSLLSQLSPLIADTAAGAQESRLLSERAALNRSQDTAFQRALGNRPKAEELAGPPDPDTGLPPMRQPSPDANLAWASSLSRFPRYKTQVDAIFKDAVEEPTRSEKTAFERTKFAAEQRHRQATEKQAQDRLEWDRNKPVAVNGKGLYLPVRDDSGAISSYKMIPGTEPDEEYKLDFDDKGPYWTNKKGTAVRSDGTVVASAPGRGGTPVPSISAPSGGAAPAAPAPTAAAPSFGGGGRPPVVAQPAPVAPAGAEGTPQAVVAAAQRELAQVTKDLNNPTLDPKSKAMLAEHARSLQETIARGGVGQAVPDASAPAGAGAPTAPAAAATPAAAAPVQSFPNGMVASIENGLKVFKAPPVPKEDNSLVKTNDAAKKVKAEERTKVENTASGMNLLAEMRPLILSASAGRVTRTADYLGAQVGLGRKAGDDAASLTQKASALLEFVDKKQFGTGSGFSNVDMATVKDIVGNLDNPGLNTSQRVQRYNAVVDKFESTAGIPRGSSGLHLFPKGKREKGFAPFDPRSEQE